MPWLPSLRPLQLSACLFLVPFVLAVRARCFFGASVYAMNWVASVANHSASSEHAGLFHAIDLGAIALWLAYNACKTATLTAEGSPPAAAVALAVAVGLLNHRRHAFAFLSWRRQQLHALMHAAGASGSAILMLCIS